MRRRAIELAAREKRIDRGAISTFSSRGEDRSRRSRDAAREDRARDPGDDSVNFPGERSRARSGATREGSGGGNAPAASASPEAARAALSAAVHHEAMVMNTCAWEVRARVNAASCRFQQAFVTKIGKARRFTRRTNGQDGSRAREGTRELTCRVLRLRVLCFVRANCLPVRIRCTSVREFSLGSRERDLSRGNARFSPDPDSNRRRRLVERRPFSGKPREPSSATFQKISARARFGRLTARTRRAATRRSISPPRLRGPAVVSSRRPRIPGQPAGCSRRASRVPRDTSVATPPDGGTAALRGARAARARGRGRGVPRVVAARARERRSRAEAERRRTRGRPPRARSIRQSRSFTTLTSMLKTKL